MKKILALWLLVFLNTFIQAQQKLIDYECLLKDKYLNSFSKVMPPALYTERTALGKTQTSTFSVTFEGTRMDFTSSGSL